MGHRDSKTTERYARLHADRLRAATAAILIELSKTFPESSTRIIRAAVP